jgi:hypothetical protein
MAGHRLPGPFGGAPRQLQFGCFCTSLLVRLATTRASGVKARQGHEAHPISPLSQHGVAP